MRKFIIISITLITSLAFVFAITGCGEQRDEEGVYKKVADGVYEVTYSDYDLNYGNQKSTDSVFSLKNFNNPTKVGGCSSVRNDNYVGRNFDIPFGTGAEVVVHVPAAKDRYASVGTFNCGIEFEGDKITKEQLGDAAYKLMPFAIVDGVNEKGVVCESNVAPAKDIGFTTGTNPGKTDLNMAIIVRYVLDKAASAKEAIDLLNECNIYVSWDFCDMTKAGYELHFIIADAQETYIIEFIDNKLVVQKDKEVLTNYYINVEGGTPNGMGLERFQILQENKSSATSADAMAKLMQKVYFSKSNDVNQEPFCYSDHFGLSLDKDGNPINLTNYNTPENKEIIKSEAANAALATEQMLKTGENPIGYWLSMSTCVFDIKACSLTLSVREKPENTWTFSAK